MSAKPVFCVGNKENNMSTDFLEKFAFTILGSVLFIVNIIACGIFLKSLYDINNLVKELKCLKKTPNKLRGIEQFQEFHNTKRTEESLLLLTNAKKKYFRYICSFRIYLGTLFICIIFAMILSYR